MTDTPPGPPNPPDPAILPVTNSGPQKGEFYHCCECGMELVVTISCTCDVADACFMCCGKHMAWVDTRAKL